jgi:polysaccharide export outer membrane protein
MILVLAMLLAAGCTRRGGSIPYAPASFPAPTFGSQGALDQDLPLGPFDQVQISVFRVPDLTGEYQIGADGKLDLPLIGTVDVNNQTPRTLAATLESQYGGRFLVNPQITVRPTQSNQRNYTVEGGVNLPGVFPIAGKTTLLTAIAQARGINTDFGNPRRVGIFREVNGQTLAAAFDVVSIRRGEMQNPAIYPGDIVVIESNGARAFYRDILSTLPLIGIFNPF